MANLRLRSVELEIRDFCWLLLISGYSGLSRYQHNNNNSNCPSCVWVFFLKITVQNCFFVLFASWDKELCQVFFFPTGIDKHFLRLALGFL